MTCLCGNPYDYFSNHNVLKDGLSLCGGCGAFYYHDAIFVWGNDGRDDE